MGLHPETPHAMPSRLEHLPRFNTPWSQVPDDLETPPGLLPVHMRADFVKAGYTKRFFPQQERLALKDGSEINLLGVVYRWTNVDSREQLYSVERCVDKQVFLATRKQYEALLPADYLARRNAA